MFKNIIIEDYHLKKITSKTLLNEELEKRKIRNSSYSLRAFARDLGISKTTVSDVINGVRRLSLQNIKVVSDALSLSPEIIQQLKDDLASVQERPRTILEDDELSFLEDWYYLAILNLAKLKVAKYDVSWISKRLALDEILVQEALINLKSKGHIENIDGRLVRVSQSISTSLDVPSSSIVEHHRQSIEKSLEALEEIPVELRDFTAVTYAIDPDQIKEIKEMILNFHRKIGKQIETKEATEVYRLNINFFPLTKPLTNESHHEK